jgi:hypothetical protein
VSGTRRVPLDRTAAVQISPRAVDLYLVMSKLKCTCTPPPPEYWKHKMCPGCARWYGLQADLHEELRCEPWQWPCVARQSPKRAGSTCWNEDIAVRVALLKEAARARRTSLEEGLNAKPVDALT